MFFKIFTLSFLITASLINGASAGVPYFEETDLSVSSSKLQIRFYKETRTGEAANTKSLKNYESAVIICSDEEIKSKMSRFINWNTYNNEGPNMYYSPLHPDAKYQNLEEDLQRISRAFSQGFTRPKFMESLSLEMADKVSLDTLIKDLNLADNVIVTFGAGLSGGYIPTLIEFFEKLGITKVASDDSATDESLSDFGIRLFQNGENILDTINQTWGNISLSCFESTPAHLALSEIIKHLNSKNKSIYVYTDNIDGIHQRVGIQLSEEPDPLDETTILIKYPPEEKLKQGNNVILACGQSFDFHGILSTIYSRAPKQETSYYSLNISPSSIAIRKNFDVEKLEEYFPPTEEEMIFLEMKWVEGSLHKTLPVILNLLQEGS